MIISPQFAHETEIITNIRNPEKQVGSDGIDLTLHSISRVDNSKHQPAVLAEDKKKTMHRKHEKLLPVNLTAMYEIESGYILDPGCYDIVFNEGCSLPVGVAGLLLARSTLIRNGCIGQCGLFDGGFSSPMMGMMIHVTHQIVLEHGMRIAQVVLWESAATKKYEGTYNNQVGADWKTSLSTD